jgi:hypothetical protein
MGRFRERPSQGGETRTQVQRGRPGKNRGWSKGEMGEVQEGGEVASVKGVF